MTRLIHLNGAPGIGKSTLAAMYADRHPGTLNLDIDTLHHLIGGWRTSEGAFHDLLRPLALAMASAHLQGGRDVMLPQCLADDAELAAFEQVAAQAGAQFHEIVLLDDAESTLARFNDRSDDSAWGRHNRDLVSDLGGDEFLSELHERLLALLHRRADAVVVQSVAGQIDHTYDELDRVLSRTS